MIYLKLFISFFKVGLFGFGGGYAMLSLIRSEVVESNQWISSSEFADIVAISQMTPGPIAINSATYIGFTASNSILGSLIATFAVLLPSLIIMLLVCYFFFKLKENEVVSSIFEGLKPALAGLIAAAAIQLVDKHTFVDYKSVILFVIAFILAFRFKTNPILLIILAGITGYILY